ncbi:MAG TPA: PD-(D/E)XK nuclease family protein [Actinomycetes bacterium]|nr:PD-(D/E)XK nuclease family protein [Actinomycetes bacterium]
MTWNPESDLEGEPSVVRVSATDLASREPCDRYLAAKVRPYAKARDWQRRFPPDKHATPFPLRDVVDVVVAASRQAPMEDYQGLEAWIRAEIDNRSPSRIVRPYLDQAIRNAIDAHTAIEDELGPLELVAVNPEIGPPERRLTVWAPLYATNDGILEVRRFRLGSARTEQNEDDEAWVRAAAWVAATYPTTPPPTRVRVIEVGLADGSVHVAFDGNWDTARSMLDAVRPKLQIIPTGTDARPGHQCGSCKVAGVCDALPHAPGVLGHDRPGHQTRSVSPSALETYAQCPARWLLSHELHLPRADDTGDAQVRGIRVHEWLHAAHGRGVACTSDDLPNPDEGMGLAEDLMTRDEYALAFPVLLSHLDVCVLGETNQTLVDSERVFHVFDETADVVVACKPDLTTARGDTLVLTEVKSSMHGTPESPQDAFSSTLQVPVMLNMLDKGLATSLGYRRAEVRLEYLTPSGAQVWTWATDDASAISNAEARLRSSAASWHYDHTWRTRPGAHCAWCPVRQWCPDRDVYLEPLTAEASTERDRTPSRIADDEEPPF